MAHAESRINYELPDNKIRSFRVLLDARKIFDGGIGVYIVNLIDALLLNDKNSLGLIVFQRDLRELEHRYLDFLPRLQFFVTDCPLYSITENTSLLANISQEDFDVFHSPHFTLPFALKIPAVVTVHDLIHIKNPCSLKQSVFARLIIALSLQRADSVLTVSNASYQDINFYFSWIPGLRKKLSVIPNSLPRRLASFVPLPSDFLRNRFKLQGNYFISVLSNLKKHKGISDLLLAFKQLKQRASIAPHDLKLVLVGYGAEQLVEDPGLLKLVGETEDVLVIGKVSDVELSFLYAGAQALVVPSLIEGFCIPALEAKAQGIPVIARAVPALKELLSSSDLIAKDLSYESFYNILESFFKSPVAHKRFGSMEVQAYLDRFSLDSSSTKLQEIYSRLVD